MASNQETVRVKDRKLGTIKTYSKHTFEKHMNDLHAGARLFVFADDKTKT